jgi:hypothetical protein
VLISGTTQIGLVSFSAIMSIAISQISKTNPFEHFIAKCCEAKPLLNNGFVSVTIPLFKSIEK